MIRRIEAFLDDCEDTSAYQYPYLAFPNDMFFVVTSGEVIVWCGRGSLQYTSGRWLPWRRGVVFNRGPVAASLSDFHDGLETVLDWARREGMYAVSIMPDVTDDGVGHLRRRLAQEGWVITGAFERFTLRLRLPVVDWKSLPSRARRKIRIALEKDLEIRYGESEEDLELFITMQHEMARMKGIDGIDLGLLNGLWDLRKEDESRMALLFALHNGSVLGVNLVVRSGIRAEYLFGAVARNESTATGGVGYYLQWAGIKWAMENGCSSYDFGGFDPTKKGGPAQMKAAFVSREHALSLAPRFGIHLTPGKRRALRTLKRILNY